MVTTSTSERIPLYCGHTNLETQSIGTNECCDGYGKVLAFKIGNVIEIKDKRHGIFHTAIIQITEHSSAATLADGGG